MIASLLFVAQVVIPHVRRSRPANELRQHALQKGREVIQRAVQAHGGLKAWQNKVDASFRLIDEWHSPAGAVFASVMNVWPEREVETVQHYLLRRNAGRIEMATGKGQHVWGYFDFRPWAKLNGEVDEESLERANFTIPAISYLFELPYKFFDKGAFPEFVNEVWHGDRIYDRVRITFGLNAGRYPTDTYVADFDQETGRLAYLEYTAREKLPDYFEFSAAFGEHQQIDGLWIPARVDFKMTAPLLSLALHNWRISEVRFDTGVEESFFKPAAGE
jgi:hypothetical protein